MLTNDDKAYILNQFLKIIFGFSDIECQTQAWIQGIGLQCSDFDETVNRFFDQSEFILENYKDFGITEEQNSILKEFWTEFRMFSDSPESNYLPEIFIEFPEWEAIMSKAKEVLKAFDWKDPSKDDMVS